MNKSNEHVWFYWLGWQGVGVFCWFMWGASSYMSYLGLITIAPNVPTWMKITAAGMSIGINFIEFMFNRMTLDELRSVNDVSDVILRMFGVVCYLYDIFTNVIAFLAVVDTATGTIQTLWIKIALNVFAAFFGFLFAVGPEPTYIKFLKDRPKFPGFGTYVPQYNKKSMPQNDGYMSPAVARYIEQKKRNAQ